MLHADGFKGLLIFLIAAGIVVPLFHRARFGTVLGFLLVGMALGPFGLGRFAETSPWIHYITFDDPKRAEPLAELGIVFLLFLLGLELSLDRLWQLRRYVFGVGLLQVVISTFAIGALVRWAGMPPPSGIVLGMCLALSSTAIVMQVLIEQHRAATKVGRIALSVLLFQDLMVVPILVIVGVFSGGKDGALTGLAWAFGQAIAGVATIMVVGHFLVRPLLRSAARTGSRDLIMAITLLIVVGISAATGAAGLSAALGAFLAGLLIGESEFRHQIEVDIDPFKGLLLGIFFVTVGMSVDIRVVLDHAMWIILSLIALLAIKASILFVAARAFRVPVPLSAELALLLAQAGEFAFVVIGLARGNNVLPAELATGAVAVAGLSMMVTPLLAVAARRLADRLDPADHESLKPDLETAKLADHVIIGGFGRVGQTIARILEKENVPYIALDTNGAVVTEKHEAGYPIYFADASRPELLERAGAKRARAFVVTVDDAEAAERMVVAIVKLRPKVRIFARAKDANHARKLADLGAIDVIPEATEAALQLAGRVLEALDLTEDTVLQRIAAARDEEVTRLERPAPASGK